MDYDYELSTLAKKVERQTGITYKRSRRDSSNNTLVYLITNSPEIDGEPLFEYLKREYPDITIGDTDIVEWAEPILKAFGEAINSGDEENLASNIQFGCNLMAAGAKENSDGVVLANAILKGFKIGEKTAIEYAKAHPEQTIDGTDVSEWANKCYKDNFKNFDFYSNDIADLMLASNLLAAGAISDQVETERLVDKLIANNLNIGDQSAASWAIDHSKGAKNFELRKEALERLIKETNTAVKSSFDEGGKKEGGYSTGSKLKSKDQSETYLQKPGAKATTNLASDDKLVLENRDLNAEYVLGSVYRNLLPTQSPDIRLVVNESELENIKHATKSGKVNTFDIQVLKKDDALPTASITSRFFKKFQTLNDFAETDATSKLGKSPKIKQVKGFEKVIAALTIMGEDDPNVYNIGIENTGTKTKPNYLAVKIDHGRSGLRVYTNEKNLQEKISRDFDEYGYHTMPFNVENFKQAIDQMIQIEEFELKSMLASRVANLDAVGFKVDANLFQQYYEDNGTILKTSSTANGVVDTYVDRLKQNMAVAKEYSKTLDIIVRSNAPDEIKDGAWVADLGRKNPILWAIENGYEIDGMKPVKWASVALNKELLKAEPSQTYIDMLVEGGAQSNHIIWAIVNNQKINQQEPLQWANDELSKEFKKTTLDLGTINELIEGGARPDEKTLDVIIERAEASNSLKFDGLTPQEYKEALSLANAIAGAAHAPNTSETAQFALDNQHVLERDVLKSISVPIDKSKIVLFMSAVSHTLADDKHGNIKLEPSTQIALMKELAKKDARGHTGQSVPVS